MSIQLFDKTSKQISRQVSLNYSTSFSLGIRLLAKDYRWAVFAVYGFVRLADEIVDTFHGFDKERLLRNFKKETTRKQPEAHSKARRDGRARPGAFSYSSCCFRV